ncbi:MAG: hypothetical protein Q7O12_10965 [Deltaproteobacteria bacterium]|nr:hypothetical protein [Deltaproteobacteria bacterium]
MRVMIDVKEIAAFRRASLRSLLGQRRGRVTMPGIRRIEQGKMGLIDGVLALVDEESA